MADRDALAEALNQLQIAKNAILDGMARVIVGQEQVIRLMLAAIFANGHCLLVGVPGLAKTMMVNALAHILDFKFIH